MRIQLKRLVGQELDQQGVYEWPIWEKEASRFDWHYDTDETCYLLEGRVEVTTMKKPNTTNSLWKVGNVLTRAACSKIN